MVSLGGALGSRAAGPPKDAHPLSGSWRKAQRAGGVTERIRQDLEGTRFAIELAARVHVAVRQEP